VTTSVYDYNSQLLTSQYALRQRVLNRVPEILEPHVPGTGGHIDRETLASLVAFRSDQ